MCISLARRCLLTLFSASFFEKQQNENPPLSIAANELDTFCTLLPLAQTKPSRTTYPLCIATDASHHSGALCYAALSRSDAESILISSRYVGGALRPPELTIELVGKIHWKLGFAHKWERTAHINILEAETILMALQWLAASNTHEQRIIFLCDSAVCISALTKDRSSSPTMLRMARRIIALQLAINVHLAFVHIASKYNLANPPSRGKMNQNWTFLHVLSWK